MRATPMLRAIVPTATCTIAAITLAASLASAPSYAADFGIADDNYVAPPATTAPEEAWRWTGVHLGIDAGGQFDFTDSSVYANNENSFWSSWLYADSEANLGSASWFISGDIGADYQVPNSQFVLGLFANYDWHPSGGSASHAASTPADCIGCSGGVNDVEAQQTRYKDVGNTVTYGDAWGVGLRAGVLVDPKILVYGLGGYGQKQINADSSFYYDYYNNLSYSGGLSGGGWQPGWFIGAGLEAAIGKHVTLAAEYRFAQYKGFSASCGYGDCAQSYQNDIGPPFGFGGPYEFNEHGFDVGKTTSHTVRARLSYWFNK